jgi:hypothetical protein
MADDFPEYDEAFDDWCHELDEKVIQAEFGYERGEFTVYPALWRSLYDEGLTPREAWQRALDAHRGIPPAGRGDG